MGEWSTAAKKQDFGSETCLCVEVSGHQIALFDVEGTYYAIDDTCTHKGGPLSEGTLSSAALICPWHGAQFDVRSGKVLRPPAQDPGRKNERA